MMLKITERCTMGCTHCLNDAKPDGRDIDEITLKDALFFLKNNDLCKESLIITGGEPTEHKEFDRVMEIILAFCNLFHCFETITITTNGEVIQNDPERFTDYVKKFKDIGVILLFQVSADVRYYPRRIAVHKRVFREEGFVLCDDCVELIYPQGRAVTNNIEWKSKASKCFNVRALAHQIPEATLRDIELQLRSHLKFCTPHISVDGIIKLGESDLCPGCATIYDDMNMIMYTIRNFKCHKCDHINELLPDMYKRLL